MPNINLERLAELVALRLQRQPIVKPEFLNPEQAAAFCGCTVKSLEHRRARGQSPRYTRVGRSVRYHIDDLRVWLEGDAPR